MSSRLVYFRTAERPDIQLWLLDEDGVLVDFTGQSLEWRLGYPGRAALLVNTTGLTGAAGSGTETAGVPNVTVTFAAGELDAVPAGESLWQLRAMSGGLDRVYQGVILIKEPII